jgi:hypothetical protein
LRQPEKLALLEPHLDVDEVIFLGDLFDFFFAEVKDALAAAGGLFDLLRERLQGKRFVFMAGNHDHDLVTRDAEAPVELELSVTDSSRRHNPVPKRAVTEARELPWRVPDRRFVGETHRLPDCVLIDVTPPMDLFVDRECEARGRVRSGPRSNSGRDRRARRTSPTCAAASAV